MLVGLTPSNYREDARARLRLLVKSLLAAGKTAKNVEQYAPNFYLQG